MDPESADSVTCLRYWLGLPEVTEDDIKRFEACQEEGQENKLFVDHYLPEHHGSRNKDPGVLEDAGVLDITGFLRYIDENMGTLVDERNDITGELPITLSGPDTKFCTLWIGISTSGRWIVGSGG
jgi:hypothetical protein